MYIEPPSIKYGVAKLENEYTWYCKCGYEVIFWEGDNDDDMLYVYDETEDEWACDCDFAADNHICKCFDGNNFEEYYGETAEEIIRIEATREYIAKINAGTCPACDKSFYDCCQKAGHIKWQIKRLKKLPFELH